VLEQQVSLVSAKAVFDRLYAAISPFTPERLALVDADTLGKIGLTRQKQRYCHEIALAITSGQLDLDGLAELPDERVRLNLMSITGIGPWTANIYLLMVLCRTDIWPMGDIALDKAVRQFIRPMEDKRQIVTIADAWIPWRSVATRILWHGYLASRR